jgi:hypothetical protein
MKPAQQTDRPKSPERRAFAQILIDEIGAKGPETAEETARRAVEIIRRLKGKQC